MFSDSTKRVEHHYSVSVYFSFSGLCCFDEAGREYDGICLCFFFSIHSILKVHHQTIAPTSPPTLCHLSATKGKNKMFVLDLLMLIIAIQETVYFGVKVL